MPSCEKCWRDSRGELEAYEGLIESRTCTPEEQAGSSDAVLCSWCKRYTIHRWAKVCMNPGCGFESFSGHATDTTSDA